MISSTFVSIYFSKPKIKSTRMGKFHHSKKHHGDKKKSFSSRLKYDLTQAGRRKLPEDFLYTQNHKSIWNSFSNFLDEKFAEESKRARARGQSLADKSYAGREAQYFDGIKKLAAKFSRATVLVLKHIDALINLDMHQFLKSDPVKRLDPETKYRRLRQYFSERWGPHSSLDVAKIKADLTSMWGDDPGWRKYLQNFNYFVGSLESTHHLWPIHSPSRGAHCIHRRLPASR